MSDLNDRLNAIAKHFNLKSYSEFAKKTGLSHQTVSNYLKGKQKPDAEKLAIIKQSFDLVNADWLLTGKGEMLRNDKNLPESVIKKFEDINDDELSLYILKNKDRILKNEVIAFYIEKLALEKAKEILKQDIRSEM